MTEHPLLWSVPALAAMILLLGPVLEWVSKRTRWQVCGELVWRVKTSQPLVALTFDDGPAPGHADGVLQSLRRHNAHATFFLTGEEIALHREDANKILAAGHEIGNHSYSHRRMTVRSPRFIRHEIEATDDLIRGLGARGEILFRPPFGKKLLLLPLYLRRKQRRTIMWTLEADKDASGGKDAESIADYVQAHVHPGTIVLFHVFLQSREAERDALPKVLERLAASGYRCVSVSDLLASAN